MNAVERLDEFRTLSAGWDGEFAWPPDSAAIDAAKALVGIIDPRHAVDVTLEVDGGICLECGDGPALTFFIKPGGKRIIMLPDRE